MACEGPIEEPGLRRFVILHGAVEVKVVPTKGRKCHGSERGAVYPMLSQGVGGHLEGRGINSTGDPASDRRLEIGPLGSRAFSGQRAPRLRPSARRCENRSE